MVVTISAKNRIRDLVAGDVSSMALGDGGNSATAADSDLQSTIESTRKAPTIILKDRTIEFRHELSTAEGNGETFRELGVFMNGDEVLLDRAVFPDFQKTEANSLTTIDIIRFD